jgi:hypothetical protein
MRIIVKITLISNGGEKIPHFFITIKKSVIQYCLAKCNYLHSHS